MPATKARRAPAVESANLGIEVRGAAARLFDEQPMEAILAGAAGTGKTRGILEWINARLQQRQEHWVFVRKSLKDLKGSALRTFMEQVLHEFDGRRSEPDGVYYHGGNEVTPARFVYEATGSTITVVGLDRGTKVKSAEYDGIYINEVTELTLDDYESLTSRTDRPEDLPEGVEPVRCIVVADCNPDAPTHWLHKRWQAGTADVWVSLHEHNPAMWRQRADGTWGWTKSGENYMARLNKLSGVRKQRLRYGRWVAAEGVVYEAWRPEVHLVDGFEIPWHWRRFRCVDFGYVNPLVVQWWAIAPDGAMHRYRELYVTQTRVSEAAAVIRSVEQEGEVFEATVRDHDAEDGATLDAELGITSVPANKAVVTGIERVQDRMVVNVDGQTGIYLHRDALISRDPLLEERELPCCTEEEIPAYVWDPKAERSGNKREAPLKVNDHGCDAMRYAVMYVDGAATVSVEPTVIAHRSAW